MFTHYAASTAGVQKPESEQVAGASGLISAHKVMHLARLTVQWYLAKLTLISMCFCLFAASDAICLSRLHATQLSCKHCLVIGHIARLTRCET